MLSGAEAGGQAGEFAQLLNLMHLPGAAHADIDLLQSDEVGFGGFDDFCQARNVIHAVHALAVVDVVAQDAQGDRVGGRAGDG